MPGTLTVDRMLLKHDDAAFRFQDDTPVDTRVMLARLPLLFFQCEIEATRIQNDKPKANLKSSS
jgi:hypothetical protein